MPNYRRAFVPGGTYFFTIKAERNAPIFEHQTAIRSLGQSIREAKKLWNFEINAMVLLPDHLHAIWTLPRGDADYPTRWAWIKKEFTQKHLQQGGREQPTSFSRRRNRRKGVWQRRYWEHTIEDEDDFEAHFDYIHFNPVKHGYVERARDWKASSFHRWVKKGVYDLNWGSSRRPPKNITAIEETVGE